MNEDKELTKAELIVKYAKGLIDDYTYEELSDRLSRWGYLNRS